MKRARAKEQAFHFRAHIRNYDYLCELARQERFCSINSCLNLLLAMLEGHDVESLDDLRAILMRESNRESG